MARQNTRAASLEGIALAKKALSRKGWTKSYLATQVVVDDDNRLNDKPVSASTIKRFFQGRPIRPEFFGGICVALDVDPDEIDAGSQAAPATPNAVEVGSQPTLVAPRVWTVPYRRNRFLTGRDGILEGMRRSFGEWSGSAQPVLQAVSGLGGLGKTQLAVEYAYRYEADYQAILWVRAETETDRIASFQEFALAQPVCLAPLSTDDAVAFLLKRTGRSPDDAHEIAAAQEFAVEVEGLPLALEQAAAYTVDRQIRFQDYLTSYRQHKLTLLQRSSPVVGDYPESVATTWALNLLHVEIDAPAAAALLRISAFLAPDAIPYVLFEQGYATLDSSLQEALESAPADPSCVPEILTALSRFSLVNIDPTERTFSVHRLVQAVIRDDPEMDEASCRQWAIQAIEMVGAVFSEAEFEHWPQCDRLLPHALACHHWIDRHAYQSEGAVRLLNHAGCYLMQQGQYGEAEPLLLAAVAMRRTLLGSSHLDLAMSLHNLGTLYRAQGRYDEAEAHYREALTLRQTLLTGDHPEIALV